MKNYFRTASFFLDFILLSRNSSFVRNESSLQRSYKQLYDVRIRQEPRKWVPHKRLNTFYLTFAVETIRVRILRWILRRVGNDQRPQQRANAGRMLKRFRNAFVYRLTMYTFFDNDHWNDSNLGRFVRTACGFDGRSESKRFVSVTVVTFVRNKLFWTISNVSFHYTRSRLVCAKLDLKSTQLTGDQYQSRWRHLTT